MEPLTYFEDNQGLALDLARRYCWDTFYQEDLNQEAKLALWEASLLYVEEGEEHDHLFQTVAYYAISNACRDYRNIFFNVITVPKNEAVSKRAYSNLHSLLEFSPEIFNAGLEPEDIAMVWEHSAEKTLSPTLRTKIRALKKRISPSKENYRRIVKRTINFGIPVPLDLNCSDVSAQSEVSLDLNRYKEAQQPLDRAILDLRVSGNSVSEIAIILKKSPRYVRNVWLKTKREIIKLVQ